MSCLYYTLIEIKLTNFKIVVLCSKITKYDKYGTSKQIVIKAYINVIMYLRCSREAEPFFKKGFFFKFAIIYSCICSKIMVMAQSFRLNMIKIGLKT